MREDPVGDMLRRHLQLAAYVMLTQLLQENIALWIRQYIVEADSGADKDLLYAGKLPQLPKKADILRMVGPQVRAGLREQALAVRAGPVLLLLFAGRAPEICRRPAHIMDIALKIRIL